jgi:primosomal protein N'
VIAKVEPLTTARALRGPFDYRLGGPAAGAGVGSVLVVPFGRRRTLGVVVEVAETSELPLERLVEPIEALEANVPPELVRLGLWVAEEYVSTPARGLALVLPPGTGTGSGRRTGARLSLSAALGWASASAPPCRLSRMVRCGSATSPASAAVTTPACDAWSSASSSRSSGRSRPRDGPRCAGWGPAARSAR